MLSSKTTPVLLVGLFLGHLNLNAQVIDSFDSKFRYQQAILPISLNGAGIGIFITILVYYFEPLKSFNLFLKKK